MTAPRAVRCANPGNIRRSKDQWQGLAKEQDDKEFFTFAAPRWGFRAMAVLLINYQDKYKLHTISGVINRWAPPVENNTVAYIEHVCELTGFGAAEVLDFHKHDDLAPIVKAIATHECGGWFFRDHDLEAGLTMAGVPPKAKELVKSRTMQAQTIAGTATVAEGGLQQYQDMLTGIAPYLEIAQYALLAIILASVGWTAYARWDDHRRSLR